jgi:hypothetical protein
VVRSEGGSNYDLLIENIGITDIFLIPHIAYISPLPKIFFYLLICIDLSITSDQFFERDAKLLASRARSMGRGGVKGGRLRRSGAANP